MYRCFRKILICCNFSLLFAIFLLPSFVLADVAPGVDVFFEGKYDGFLRGKRIGLITHYAAINKEGIRTVELFKQQAKRKGYTLVALFAPEHGMDGKERAEVLVDGEVKPGELPVYSLHGATQRPTDQMLQNIDLLVFDMQDVGCRSYTYLTTLCYVLEEAGKRKLPVVVLDRPNPINGLVVDGPMLEEAWRSFVGYCNVPYCHGMTLGELARFFHDQEKLGSELTVVPMRGWKRSMSFKETGLTWIPTSPNIPESTTPFYYPMTGILGELQIVNIGIGYTLPFRVVAAPWMDGDRFAKELNQQKLPGVQFFSFSLSPFFGRFTNKPCQGVLLHVTDPVKFRPVTTQYTLLGLLKSLYPEAFAEALKEMQKRKEMFCKVNGTARVYDLLQSEGFITWKLRGIADEAREGFMKARKKYLIAEYQE